VLILTDFLFQVLQHDDGCTSVQPRRGIFQGCWRGQLWKRPWRNPPKIGHFHDDVGPTHFANIMLALGLKMFAIPPGFYPYLGTVPRTIILKKNTGCSWMDKLKDVNGTTDIDQGCPIFSITHDIKIGYFITFKVLRSDVFKVTIFDYIMTEMVKRCPHHDPFLAIIDE
jgi:hypothetical protein